MTEDLTTPTPDAFEKFEFDIPISFAFSFINSTKLSSVPAMPSAKATQASFPEATMIPLNKSSTDISSLTTILTFVA